MKKIFLFILLVFFISPILGLSEGDVTLNLDKIFYLGDTVNLHVNIINTKSSYTYFDITTVLEPVREKEAIYFEGGLDRVGVSGKQSKSIVIPVDVIVETIPPGEYYVVVEITEGGTTIKKRLDFNVSGTKKIINADLVTCKDKLCNDIIDVFKKGEPIKIKVITEVEDLQVNLKTISPDDKEEELIVINYGSVFNTDVQGNYIAEAILTKEGYQDRVIDHKFSISNEIYMADHYICNSDGTCSKNENFFSCPQDCSVIDKLSKSWISFLMVLFIILIIAYYFIYKKKDKNKKEAKLKKEKKST